MLIWSGNRDFSCPASNYSVDQFVNYTSFNCAHVESFSRCLYRLHLGLVPTSFCLSSCRCLCKYFCLFSSCSIPASRLSFPSCSNASAATVNSAQLLAKAVSLLNARLCSLPCVYPQRVPQPPTRPLSNTLSPHGCHFWFVAREFLCYACRSTIAPLIALISDLK